MDLNNELAAYPKWFHAVLVLALLLGGSGSAMGIFQDAHSRYRAEDAARDFALRDERTARLDFDIKETKARQRELERELRAHLRTADAHGIGNINPDRQPGSR